ncbi:hypothetical protein M9H77_17775 [Catharanthus roseus]|uniref:Uncharacterized protein n=1 Tax=Catharanthus roseus TaxID=4058 RepID=A0ACC0B5J2_CATRO|nr:hypothetical protein M9H77_17775 [Catharanthus roseus]
MKSTTTDPADRSQFSSPASRSAHCYETSKDLVGYHEKGRRKVTTKQAVRYILVIKLRLQMVIALDKSSEEKVKCCEYKRSEGKRKESECLIENHESLKEEQDKEKQDEIEKSEGTKEEMSLMIFEEFLNELISLLYCKEELGGLSPLKEMEHQSDLGRINEAWNKPRLSSTL